MPAQANPLFLCSKIFSSFLSGPSLLIFILQYFRSAKADADQIIKSAEAYKESKINEASGQAARFSELYAEYEKYPLITKQRLFYETMESILPNAKLYIVDAETGVQTALPLESFANINVGG